ncbi:MAG: D-alanine--D-alanine ligase [bacterium]|nr:D-alanine--D-alanine ligase [bacterium]
MKILILAGGTSNERDVSLRSGQAVAEAMRELRHDYTVCDPAESSFDIKALTEGVDAVFISLHGAGGEDGSIQAELEALGVPYTGSGSNASKLCFDKDKYKKFLNEHDFTSVEGKLVSSLDLDDSIFKSPFVLKPFDGGSSLDTIIAREVNEQKMNDVKALLNLYPKMLAEKLIVGNELTVGIFDDKALPVIEIIPPEGLEFDYENKYNGATQELCPPLNIPEDVQAKAQDIAMKIHNLTNCKDMSRTDFMLDSNNQLYVLETNTIPGHTSQSLLPKMLAAAGITFSEFVDRLIQLALVKQC